ncbi:MAG: N-formylglutamate amidohydrolase [Thermoprotei archaeon]|nr:N-formylglutamate amidohydrolase [Thermoprotei archaeon]
MNLNVIEGYVEIKGEKPILITALHGFGTDRFKDVVDKIRELGLEYAFSELIPSRSAVDFLTWEIAFKVAVATGSWAILPTISKVDSVDELRIPDYNLNKEYAKETPLWRRIEELVNSEHVRLIIDIHGMKNVSSWPDICISTNGLTTVSRNTLNNVLKYFKMLKLNVAVDRPFKGGALIRYFGKPPNVEALGIELKRNLRFFRSEIPKVMAGLVRELLKKI